MKKLTTFSNPENRRCQYFIQAALNQGLPTPLVVSYLDIVQEKVDLQAVLNQTDYLRLESPGENFELLRHLLALGAEHPDLGAAEQISAQKALTLPFEKGRIQYLRQAHFGFVVLLNKIQQALDKQPLVKTFNSVESILLMFDKITCHQHFSEHQIAVPPALYNVQNYDDLRAKMAQKSWSKVFIKPNFGSSASGVMAYRVQGSKLQGSKEQMTTSIELVKKGKEIFLFNALKIQQYTDKEDIKTIIDTIAKEGIIVETWIPKASFEEGIFDLRMLVINNKTQQVVLRQSSLPMTNLHLGNQRGNLALLQEQIGAEKWQSLCDLAESAAKCLPHTFYVGLDILLSSKFTNAYILEANAFGDLLPNVFINGMDSYGLEIRELM